MRKAGGGGLILVGIVLVIMGAVLRWDLIDWLIDATGFVLIVVGIVIGIVGLFQMLTGGRGRSSDY